MREWAFSELRGDSLEEVELDDGVQVDGLLHELHDFGPTFRDSDVFFPDDDGNIVVAGLARDHVDGYGVARVSPAERRVLRSYRAGRRLVAPVASSVGGCPPMGSEKLG